MIGTVGKPHGLRGAFFISGRSEPFPPRCKQVVLGLDPDQGRSFKVSTSQLQQDRPVMALTGVADRTAIENMRGEKIWIERGSLAIDDSSEYLWSDVTGAEVFDAAGVAMGRIVEMVNYGASDIAVVEDDAGRRLELPFVDVYVDMSFSGPVTRINLVVEAAVFGEFWAK